MAAVLLMRVHLTGTQEWPFYSWATIDSAEALYTKPIAETPTTSTP